MLFEKVDSVVPKKTVAVVLVISVITLPVLAQVQMEDVVYLKDGSVVRGQIIEQVPNVSVKIQTKDGSVFLYKMDNVLKITKEPLKRAVPEEKANDYVEGKRDGERDAKGNPLWIFAGLSGTYFCLLIGCTGVGIAYLVKPSPPAEKLMGKSADYVLGYTEAYRNKARNENVRWAALGCATAALINLTINIATGNFPPKLE